MKYQDGSEEEIVGAPVAELTGKSLEELSRDWAVTRVFLMCGRGYMFQVEWSLSGHFVIVRMGNVPGEVHIPTQEIWFEKATLRARTYASTRSDVPWLRKDRHLIQSIIVSHSRS